MLFLRIFKHLLPRARAWRITTVKRLREFFQGLSVPLGDDVKQFADDVHNDLFPQTTRELDEWEKQFGLPDSLTDEQERRDRLAGAWVAQGGQSPRYIQDTLQNAGFDVFVHEWWELPIVAPPGPQIARNPLYLLGAGVPYQTMQDGAPTAQDGGAFAQDGGQIARDGYALVNKPAPTPPIPLDPTKFPYFLYIAGENFVDNPSGIPTVDFATVPATRENEFETLLLKICPAQQWIGVLVDFV